MVSNKIRNTSILSTIIIIALIFIPIHSLVSAKSNTILKPTDQFAIPYYNSNISFTINGTYDQASLENNSWNFVNLQLSNSQQIHNLTVSAQNCNVTILYYRTSNTTFVSTSLRYTIEGQGKQIFNFKVAQNGGLWSVNFNGTVKGENDGWNVSPNQTITVTGAPSNSNVSLTYFLFSNSLGGNGSDSSLPFYQRHSVIIGATIALAITAGLAMAVSLATKKKKQTVPNRKDSASTA
jgi:hypothetical protein